MRVLEWIKWFFWGSWHGESVSAFDVRRAAQSSAPQVEVGGFRFPRWLLWLMTLVVILLIVFMVLQWFGIILTTQGSISTRSGLVSAGACTARDQANRLYIAVDCLVSACFGDQLVLRLLATLLLVVVGFIVGWVTRGWKIEKEAEQ